MVEKATFDMIKRKHGAYASWVLIGFGLRLATERRLVPNDNAVPDGVGWFAIGHVFRVSVP